MDFTEPVTTGEQTSKHDESSNSENTKQSFPAMSRLESEIDDVYTSIESKISTFWSTASRSIHGPQRNENADAKSNSPKQETSNLVLLPSVSGHDEVLPGEELSSRSQKTLDPKIDLASISIQANKALDELDSKLEIVEKRAGNLVSSITSFFSTAAVSSSTVSGSKVKDSSPLPIIPGDAYGSSRYDMELFKLHTTTDFFLDGSLYDEAELREFKVDEKTQEISNLLGRYQGTLENLMNKLVPTQITYNQFWFRYFKQESKLRAGEKARKELLGDKGEVRENLGFDQNGPETACNQPDKQAKVVEETKESEDEEDFLWDDDDEVETSDS
ncbi:hypothetical protein JCM33374_g6388 [Metschnikowia sp. JCM 33374]|nr:hypothetical protein JCM33374_g6388 [Metschnikowia sp. JCM 33374]